MSGTTPYDQLNDVNEMEKFPRKPQSKLFQEQITQVMLRVLGKFIMKNLPAETPRLR